ncbi:MAG: GNAT family N-acetyltransferase [Wenzhouxiangellaceae bacterium]
MPNASSTTAEGRLFGTIEAGRWNALNRDGGPFTDHRFLQALHAAGCLADTSGWHLLPVACQSGVAPTWLKHHSHGEFVFDHLWADAAHRAGLHWFPKLVVAVPLTPVPGPRLLADDDAGRTQLVELLEHQVAEHHASSCAINFCDRQDQATLGRMPNWLARSGWQFHWHNRGWGDFDDFLGSLRHKPRKNIRRERRLAAGNGWHYRWVDGCGISEDELSLLDRCYQTTFMLYGNLPLLNREFFRLAAQSFGENFLACIASRHGRDRAAAIFWRNDKRLYGRYWGALEETRDVHFEACYYQGIEYCIEHGLEAFEPGAQGEHKIRRGFTPVATRSYHYIVHPGLREGIRRWLEMENRALVHYREQLEDLIPYR